MAVRCRRKANVMNHLNDTGMKQSPESTTDGNHGKSHADNDFFSICLLTFLYVMQGIPLGLAAAVPYILQSNPNTADYGLQAIFYFSHWPFSMKVLWAPLVDSVYSTRFGRRKSWLIPMQYAIGIDLLVLASYVDQWLGREPSDPWGGLGVTNPVCIYSLTAAFFGLTMLAATQDIAVDGWALTMLSKRNIGWASTCNSIGQSLGYVIAFVLFLCLESPHIANTYFRSTPVEGRGFITFSGFLFFWGVAFLVTTTVILLFKHEEGSIITEPLKNCIDKSCKKMNEQGLTDATTSHIRPRITGDNAQLLHQTTTRNSRVESDPSTEISILDDGGELYRDGDDDQVLLDLSAISSPSLANQRPVNGSSSHSAGCPVIEVFHDEPLHEPEVVEKELSLAETYWVMFGILRLKPIMQYIGMTLLYKACFAAQDSISTFKLIEQGVPKENLAFIGVLLLPIHTLLPLFITHWTNGPQPITVSTLVGIPRLFLGLAVIPFIHFTPYFATPVNQSDNLLLFNLTANGSNIVDQLTFGWTFYIILIIFTAINSAFGMISFITRMGYHARISDPLVGGTYMTSLNTATNLAGILPANLFLAIVEPMTIRKCVDPDPIVSGDKIWQLWQSNPANYSKAYPVPLSSERDYLSQLGRNWIVTNATCKAPPGIQACQFAGGQCSTSLDGFYLQLLLSFIVGIIFLPLFLYPLAVRLDALPQSAYTFRLRRPNVSSRSAVRSRLRSGDRHGSVRA